MIAQLDGADMGRLAERPRKIEFRADVSVDNRTMGGGDKPTLHKRAGLYYPMIIGHAVQHLHQRVRAVQLPRGTLAASTGAVRECGISGWPGKGTASRRREFCHFTDAPSPSLLVRLLKGEGGAAD